MTDQFCCFFQIGLIDESSRCGSPSAAAAASASCCLNLGGCFWCYEWNRCPGAAWMVLWPFRLIADKLVKMIGGRAARHNAGGDEEDVEAKEGRLFSFRFDRPVSCRSRFVDVGLLPLLSQFSSVSAADCPAWSMMVVSCGFLGPSCAAAIRLGLRPRLRVDGLEDHRVGAVRHPRPREALSHHKVSPLSSYSLLDRLCRSFCAQIGWRRMWKHRTMVHPRSRFLKGEKESGKLLPKRSNLLK